MVLLTFQARLDTLTVGSAEPARENQFSPEDSICKTIG